LAATTTSLVSIERTAFGKALSETIQLQMRMQGGVDVVIGMIWDLDTSIGDEQSAHDAEYATTKADCEATLADYANKIAVAETDKKTA
jgi:hypothetical protein